jgi:hypothetical protein
MLILEITSVPTEGELASTKRQAAARQGFFDRPMPKLTDA